MTRRQQNELVTLQCRIDRLAMTTSDRAAATTALQNGFVIVERLTWLARNVLHFAALFRPTPALRPH